MFINKITLSSPPPASLHVDRQNNIVVPFLFRPTRSYPNKIAQVFKKYPELLSRLVCATPRAFLILCSNEKMLKRMSDHLKTLNRINILAPIEAGLIIERIGANEEYFALTCPGESMVQLLGTFFELSASSPIIQSGIELIRNASRGTKIPE